MFSAIAKSNLLLTSQTSVGYSELKNAVVDARCKLQKVIDAVIMTCDRPQSVSREVWILRTWQNSPVLNQIMTPPSHRHLKQYYQYCP